MKNCPKCGSPQRDEAVECRSCGCSFVTPPPDKPVPPKILLVSRVWLWFCAWAVAVIVMLIDAHSYWRNLKDFSFFSPLAFVTALFVHPQKMIGPEWNLCITVGWIYYAVLTAVGFSVKRYRVFFWLFMTLSFSLALNCLLWLLAIYLVSHS